MTTTDNTQVSVTSPAAASSTQRFARRPGPRGVQLEDVLTAADEIVAKGQKPTIERVRQHLGGGSPNTVSPMLDVWFERLPQRLVGVAAPESRSSATTFPVQFGSKLRQHWLQLSP
ncbi:replication region DNA-binding N-term [Variovorax sp. HW608]|uniref:DNA-binding protein n=1 Tax=Variovorax sp. HW608 TaxID=1034889 RepID=UPI00081FC5FD|nr:replication region DNA-binding N-term [Variovorax sp. HW608]